MSSSLERWKTPVIWAVLIAVGLAGFALGGWVFRGDPPVQSGSSVAGAQDTAAAGVNQMYTCSMHPQVRSPNRDDKCPICGMDLIPVPMDDDADGADDPAGAVRLRLSPRAVALMRIQVQPVERRRVQVPVRLFGRLGYDETRLRTIAAWVPGRLERLHVDFTGVAVEQGQPMVEIYSPKLIAAQEEFLQTIHAVRELEAGGEGIVLDTTRRTIAAARDRLRLLGLDAQHLERIEQQERVDDHLTIAAPLSGIVIERLAAAGDYVDTGQPIYRLADLSHLWVQLEVYESDLQWLALGQKASFTTQSYPGERFEGTVSFIDPTVSDRTRTVRVRVDMPNPEGRLKPGMFVRGVVHAEAGHHAHAPADDEHGGHGDHPDHEAKASPDHADLIPLVIPATAPLITGRRAVVYVQLPGTDRPTFEPRDIVLGPRVGAWYIVHEGLKEGDLVVTHGSFKIDSELQIRGRPSMMQPEGGPPPTHDHGHEGGGA